MRTLLHAGKAVAAGQLANYLDCQKIHGGLPPGITLVSASDFEEWLLDIRVLDQNPLYIDRVFRLKFKFNSSYPIGTNICPRLRQRQPAIAD